MVGMNPTLRQKIARPTSRPRNPRPGRALAGNRRCRRV